METIGKENERHEPRRMKQEAPYANECQFLCDFEVCLKESLKDLRFTPYQPVNEDYIIEWCSLICRKCRIHFETSKIYLDHIIQCQFTAQDDFIYSKYGLVLKEIQNVVSEAQADRIKSSFLAKRIVNDDEMKVIVPLSSRLVPFMARGISVHLDKWPGDSKRCIFSKVKSGRKQLDVFFTAKSIDKLYEEYSKKREQRRDKRKFKELLRCRQHFELAVPDIVIEDASRSLSNTCDLVKALNLPKTGKNSTQNRILEGILQLKKKKMTSKSSSPKDRSTISRTKSNRIGSDSYKIGKVNGNNGSMKMTPAKRKLISDFTSDFLTPMLPKRKPISPQN